MFQKRRSRDNRLEQQLGVACPDSFDRYHDNIVHRKLPFTLIDAVI